MSLDLNSFVSTSLEPLRVTVSADTPFYGYINAPQTVSTGTAAFTSGGNVTPMFSPGGNVGFIPPALPIEDYRWPYAPFPEPDPSINVENFNLYLQGLTDGNNREWLGSKAELDYLGGKARELGNKKFSFWSEGYLAAVVTFDNQKWTDIVKGLRLDLERIKNLSFYSYSVTSDSGSVPVSGGIY